MDTFPNNHEPVMTVPVTRRRWVRSLCDTLPGLFLIGVIAGLNLMDRSSGSVALNSVTMPSQQYPRTMDPSLPDSSGSNESIANNLNKANEGEATHEPLVSSSVNPLDTLNHADSTMLDIAGTPEVDVSGTPDTGLNSTPIPDAALPKEVEPTPVPVAAKPALDQPKGKVEFFKTEVHADRIAFVVDRSGSMSGQRFERAKYELDQSVFNLVAPQKCFVTFFDDVPLPMFSRPARLETANGAFKKQFRSWLEGVSTNGGTFPEQSLRMAAELKPDTIYFLTDGGFSQLPQDLVQFLIRNKIKVNTIAFEDEGGARQLEELAKVTHGVYRFIAAGDVPPRLNLDFAVHLSHENAELLKRLVHHPPSDQWEQAHGAFTNPPSLVEEMIQLLKDPNSGFQADVSTSLAYLTQDNFFAVPDGADPRSQTDRVYQMEQRYPVQARGGFLTRMQRAPPRISESVVVQTIDSPNPHQRWAVARYLSDQVPPHIPFLIRLLSIPDSDVRALGRMALVRIAKDQDFGPQPGAAEDDLVKAVVDWELWYEDRIASSKLSSARNMLKLNPEKGKSQLQSLIDSYPDTQAAFEAESILSTLP